jgi:hypothetical protein
MIIEQKAQGDLLINKVDALPQDIVLSPLNDCLVAEGEQSGHNHRLVPTDEQSIITYYKREDGFVYMNIVSGSATLGHWHGQTRDKADHEALTFTPGFYIIHPQREYDELGDRKVID